mmetsp:Transcript_20529/g.58138  ORF Transcript_20529/g.58138 Transcript_20529/m.58138 type:complete len:207 (-) Transcript_20529:125-745(-)
MGASGVLMDRVVGRPRLGRTPLRPPNGAGQNGRGVQKKRIADRSPPLLVVLGIHAHLASELKRHERSGIAHHNNLFSATKLRTSCPLLPSHRCTQDNVKTCGPRSSNKSTASMAPSFARARLPSQDRCRTRACCGQRRAWLQTSSWRPLQKMSKLRGKAGSHLPNCIQSSSACAQRSSPAAADSTSEHMIWLMPRSAVCRRRMHGE